MSGWRRAEDEQPRTGEDAAIDRASESVDLDASAPTEVTSVPAAMNGRQRADAEQPRTGEDAAIDRASGLGRSGLTSAPTEVTSVPAAMSGWQRSEAGNLGRLRMPQSIDERARSIWTASAPAEVTSVPAAMSGWQRSEAGSLGRTRMPKSIEQAGSVDLDTRRHRRSDERTRSHERMAAV